MEMSKSSHLLKSHWSESIASSIPATAPIAFAIIAVKWYNHNRKKVEKGNDDGTVEKRKEPPVTPFPAHTFLMNIVKEDGHTYSMHVCRQMGDTFCLNVKWYSFLQHMYVISDHQAVHKAFEHAASTKWEPTLQFFVDTTNGGMNMIVANGHCWKHVHKSTLVFFSSPDMMRLVQETIEPILDEWIEQVLEPFIARSGKDSECLDIAYEMNKITADVITRGAFDYKLTIDE